MSRKSLFVPLIALLLFSLLTALAWQHHFANMRPLLRDLVGDQLGPDMQIFGDSPSHDIQAMQAIEAEAKRGDAGAQFMHALTLEPFDMKSALLWHQAAADQGYELAIARLEEIRLERTDAAKR
ncbi:hypothetical protein [Bordetella genomosp. 1]|uniref:Sel1 repeat family protein n=1 Tax=Bordetella genomosp. 1 TaxID=1395607 RepID=A0ABX4EYA9_9BORD|nr:hypothetical protein [Bordetella genomosp. 1]OZI64063.1 hypothetical protein CAL27_15895 [Bordetella genomosp. 1]